MTKEMKIVFAEGCFDGFDGTQEELAEFIADIQNMANNGTLMENAKQLTLEEEEELANMLAQKEKRQ